MGTRTPRAFALVADDEDGVAGVLSALLACYKIEIRRAVSGPEVLRIGAEGGMQLLLLDVNLPGIDGYGVLARLRGEAWGRDLPVIVVTGDDRSVHDEIAKAFGAGRPVRKPFDLEDVSERLRAVLGTSESRVA